MGNLRQKYTDEEWELLQSTKSYTGLGFLEDWRQTTTNELITTSKDNNDDVVSLLKEFREWEYDWRNYVDGITQTKPKNAIEFSLSLGDRYNIKLK